MNEWPARVLQIAGVDDQDSDNCDHDKQFDERKRGLASFRCRRVGSRRKFPHYAGPRKKIDRGRLTEILEPPSVAEIEAGRQLACENTSG